jgi:hypothetical protein
MRRAHGFKIGLINLSLLFLSVAMKGQETPFDVGQSMATAANLQGTWVNVDHGARNIVRISIAGIDVHPYGACHPALCDWGLLKGQPFASKVDQKDVSAVLVSRITEAGTVLMTISMESDGRLRVQSLTRFRENDTRANYSVVDYFVRSPANSPAQR